MLNWKHFATDQARVNRKSSLPLARFAKEWERYTKIPQPNAEASRNAPGSAGWTSGWNLWRILTRTSTPFDQLAYSTLTR